MYLTFMFNFMHGQYEKLILSALSTQILGSSTYFELSIKAQIEKTF